MKVCLHLFAVFAALGCGGPAAALESGERVDNFRLLDQDGGSHELYYHSDARAVVHWGDQTREELNVGWFRFRSADHDDRAAAASARVGCQSAAEYPAAGGRSN